MISKTEVSASYRHVSLEILNEFSKVLGNVSLELGKQRDQSRISIESKVENPLTTIESFNRQFQIGEKEREAVKWGWDGSRKWERPCSMWSMPTPVGHSLRDCLRRRVIGFRR